MGNSCCDRKRKTGQSGFREIDVCEYNSTNPDNHFKRGCKDVRFDSNELSKYPQNVSETTKYNMVTFLPKALWFQFKKYTNIYFGLLLIPACFPSIAAYGLDSQLPPFLFILLVALVREGVEDFRRHKSDREFNKSPCKIIRYNKTINTNWRNIVVGDIVVLRNDERIPADMIVLGTSNPDGRCYMETSTLDGEKSLKPREALKKPAWSRVKLDIDNDERVTSEADLHFKMFLPKPTYDLNDFNSGYVHFYDSQLQLLDDDKLKVGLGTKNLLLKGAKLKNTRWVLATVAYTGSETKIQLNATSAKFKTSQMEIKLHKMVIAIFAGQIAISIFCSFGRPILNLIFAINFQVTAFLGFVGETPATINSATGIESNLLDGFRYFLLLNTLIPISLIVNLEVLRVVQAAMFKGNYTLENKERDIGCTANTASVNEELGQIEYILTDKTGTLTQNKMTLRGLYIGNQIFGGELREDPLLGKTRFFSYAELHKKGMRITGPTEDEFDPNLRNLLKSDLQTQLPCRKFLLANPEEDNIRAPWEKADKGSFLHNASLKIRLNEEQKSLGHIHPEQPSHSKSLLPQLGLMDQSLSAIPERNFESNNTMNFNSLFPHRPSNLHHPPKPQEEPSTQATAALTGHSLSKPSPAPNNHNQSDLSLANLLHELHPDSADHLLLPKGHNNSFEPHLTTYQELTEEFLLAAAICHECVIEKDVSQSINYHGPSPDEIAICKGVSQIGAVFANRDIDGSVCVKMRERERNIQVLMVEFGLIRFFRLIATASACPSSPRRMEFTNFTSREQIQRSFNDYV